jgi:hypothetical protein
MMHLSWHLWIYIIILAAIITLLIFSLLATQITKE